LPWHAPNRKQADGAAERELADVAGEIVGAERCAAAVPRVGVRNQRRRQRVLERRAESRAEKRDQDCGESRGLAEREESEARAGGAESEQVARARTLRNQPDRRLERRRRRAPTCR